MTPEIWTQIVSLIVDLAKVLLVPLALAGINVLLKKAKLDQNQAVQAAVRSAIAFAEEQGALYLKQTGAKLDPSLKLNAAVERILVKIPNITEAEAKALVQEEIVKVGLGAVNSFRGIVNAVQSPAQ